MPRLIGAVLLVAWLLTPLPALAGVPVLNVSAPTGELREMVHRIVSEVGPRLEAWLGAAPAAMRVRVADSRSDFDQAAAQLGGPSWAAALAVPDQHLILIRSPKQLGDPYTFRPLLVHEMTHLYLASAMRGVRPPLWLEEGLAMYAAGEGSWSKAAVMTRAVATGKLLPLGSISRSFPSEAGLAELAYAESYYLVGFLLNQGGPQALAELVKGLASGLGVSASLKRATGRGLFATEQAFFSHLETRFSWMGWLVDPAVVWAVVGLLAAVGLVVRRRAQRRRKRRMPPDGAGVEAAPARRWPPPARPRDVLGEAGLRPRREPRQP